MKTLQEAEGFAALGLFQDAWDIVESLDPQERATPEVLHVRLHCCLGLQSWKMAEGIADILRSGSEPDRGLAATAFQALAGVYYAAGDVEKARALVKAAIDANPQARIAILDDPAFPRDFI